MSKSLFVGFMEKMLCFPLWIKQTIFLSLSKDLNTYLSNEFLDVEEDDIEAWCKGRADIPDDKMTVITKKFMVEPDLLKRNMESLDVCEETRLFTAGVRIGALVKNLFSEPENVDASFGKKSFSFY